MTKKLLSLIALLTFLMSCNTEKQETIYPYGDQTIDLGYCQLNSIDEYNQMCKELGQDTISTEHMPHQWLAQKNSYYPLGSTVHIHFVNTPNTKITRDQLEFGINQAKSVYREQQKKKNLKFKFTTGVLGDANSLIADRRFGFENTGSWSFPGDLSRIPEMKFRINTNLGWFSIRTTRHESDHDMGRLHSHQNWRCGEKDTAFILNKYKNSGWSEATIFAQVINNQNSAFTDAGECVCDLMFYPFVKGEFKNGFTCNPPSDWSESDAAFDRFAYPFDDKPVIVTPIDEDPHCDELQAQLNECIDDRNECNRQLNLKNNAFTKIKTLLVNYQNGGEKTEDVQELILSLYEECNI